ncbi:hypothetical protein PWT90_05413 [Aphanocladium album]|nr:hypothetical protein PWT90_05413 [Aphanocladium album]
MTRETAHIGHLATPEPVNPSKLVTDNRLGQMNQSAPLPDAAKAIRAQTVQNNSTPHEAQKCYHVVPIPAEQLRRALIYYSGIIDGASNASTEENHCSMVTSHTGSTRAIASLPSIIPEGNVLETCWCWPVAGSGAVPAPALLHTTTSSQTAITPDPHQNGVATFWHAKTPAAHITFFLPVRHACTVTTGHLQQLWCWPSHSSPPPDPLPLLLQQ